MSSPWFKVVNGMKFEIHERDAEADREMTVASCIDDESDANLIAAAPALRDALKHLLDNWPRHRDGMDNEALPSGVMMGRLALALTQETQQ